MKCEYQLQYRQIYNFSEILTSLFIHHMVKQKANTCTSALIMAYYSQFWVHLNTSKWSKIFKTMYLKRLKLSYPSLRYIDLTCMTYISKQKCFFIIIIRYLYYVLVNNPTNRFCLMFTMFFMSSMCLRHQL